MASRHNDTALRYLTKTVLSLQDDYSKPWDSYPCLLWDRNFYWDGYGKVKVTRTHARAHRLAYVLLHGEIPKSVLICHHCDNPACFRPIHLFTGDDSANMQDCVAKGRHICMPKIQPEIMPRGENHANVKLTTAQVLRIRNEPITNQRLLAEELGVTQTLISRVLLRKTWKHI